MRYLSIDLETTGRYAEWCQILEIGAVLDDTSWPEVIDDGLFGGRPWLHGYVVHERVVGEPYALMMNADAIKRIARREDYQQYKFWTPEEAACELMDFVVVNFPTGKVTAAGKNFNGFDRLFLRQLPEMSDFLERRFHHRAFDPALLYFREGDQELPGLQQCLLRAGIQNKVMHTACEDAYQVIQSIRAGIFKGEK